MLMNILYLSFRIYHRIFCSNYSLIATYSIITTFSHVFKIHLHRIKSTLSMNKIFFSFLKEKTPPIAKVPFWMMELTFLTCFTLSVFVIINQILSTVTFRYGRKKTILHQGFSLINYWRLSLNDINAKISCIQKQLCSQMTFPIHTCGFFSTQRY